MLRPDRAEIVDESGSGMSPSPSPSSVGEDVFMWSECGEEERRPSTSSINTIIMSAEELDNEISVNQPENNHNNTENQQDTMSTTLVDNRSDDRGMVHHIPVVRIHTCE